MTNLVICVSGVGSNKPFQTLIAGMIPCLDMLEKTQCFPLLSYDADGTNCRENITDQSLARFREHYARTPPRTNVRITKADIFLYVYGLLHHPGYRARHALSLRRELPRIPLAPDFATFRDAGRDLAALHLGYENGPRHELEWETSPGRSISYRVEKMRPGRKIAAPDGSPWKIFDSLVYNDTLTLRGIPPEAFAYRLGTRSALEWVIDQYRVKTDKRSGIISDPNDYSADERYILHLLERVIHLGVETARIVERLGALPLA